MEQTFQNSFRSQVFDQRTFDLFLEVLRLIESCEDSVPLARKFVLDSFVFSDSIERSIQFFNALNSFEKNDLQNNLSNIARFIPPFRNFSEPLFQSFLLTMRTLAKSEKSIDLGSFLKAFQSILQKDDEAAEGFSKSVRHCTQYFHTEESFIGIFKTLTQFESEHEYDAFSLGQLESKKWLLHEAEKVIGKNWGKVFILAGWMGVLPRLIFDQNSIETEMVRSFDLDKRATGLSETLNSPQVIKDWKFKSSNMDIRDLSYPVAHFTVRRKDGTVAEMSEAPDVIINTSCEHIRDVGQWFENLPLNVNLVLQSNDAFGLRDHHGCVESLEEFKRQLPLKDLLYEGTLELGDYRRFMLIGRR